MTMRLTIVGLILCLLSQAGAVFGEPVAEYLPLNSGNFWTYRVTGPNGTYTVTATVLPNTIEIYGVPTKAIKFSGGPDDQTIEYWTNDQQGIRLHGGHIPYSDAGPATLTFEPPVVYARRTMNIGETVYSSGNARFVFDYYGTFVLNYESSSMLDGTETINVPAGSFETIRIREQDRIYGSIFGEPYEDNSSGFSWFAKYIGEVKGTDNDDSGTEVEVLISTNVKPQPTATYLPFLQLLLD